MELVIIGSGTGALRAERGPSGYVLLVANQMWLLDGGSGTLRKCLEIGLSYRDFDKVFYTHLHPDHTIDLVPLLFATKHTPGFKREKPLEFYGPVGFRRFFETLIDLYGTGMTDVEYDLSVRELSEEHFQLERVAISTRHMQHSGHAIGYRFEYEGKALVYSGDTDYCEAIIELAYGADVLVLECSFPDRMKVPGHLTPSEAGRIAATAEVKKLVLTHFYEPCDQEDILEPCRRQFTGEVVKAEDLMRVTV